LARADTSGLSFAARQVAAFFVASPAQQGTGTNFSQIQALVALGGAAII
jgi:hypothetical protein